VSQAIEPTFTEGSDVPLHGGASEAGDLGCFLAGDATVEQPEDEHFPADMLVRVGVAFVVDNLLLLLSQFNPKPSHRRSP